MAVDAAARRLATTLGLRMASALDAQQANRPIATGVRPLDDLLGGGLPRGTLVEVAAAYGTHEAWPGAGRGALSIATIAIAALSTRGELVALVDASDRMDPRNLATAGADLSRVLWIRPTTFVHSLRAADLVLEARVFSLVVLDLVGAARPRDAVWMRLAQRAERSDSTLLVLSTKPLVGLRAAVTVEIGSRQARFTRVPGSRQILLGARLELRRAHQRSPTLARSSELVRPLDLEHGPA